MSTADPDEEFTIDELAERAGMTVRNVRAYAGRSLLQPPRMVARTGFYNIGHLQRLRLIRQLLSHGYTLAAVENAILKSPDGAPGHALELLSLLEAGHGNDQSELITRSTLAALAGVRPDDELFDVLPSLGLAEYVDADTLRIFNPQLVRAGAAARALGLTTQSVIDVVPLLYSTLGGLAEKLVDLVSNDLVQPFLDAGLPEDDWTPVFSAVEAIIPIASTVTLAVFREQLEDRVQKQISIKLAELGETSTGVD